MLIPLPGDSRNLRFPIVTVLIVAAMGATWLLVQGAGFDPVRLMASVCKLGLRPGALTGRAAVGTQVPLGMDLYCVMDHEPINYLTPVLYLFLHGGWAHLLVNGWYLFCVGSDVEDSMGRARFLGFYLLCGLAAALAHIAIYPGSPAPLVGAAGAISGVVGASVILYPRKSVPYLVAFFVIRLPNYFVLIIWAGTHLVVGLIQWTSVRHPASIGITAWDIGGFFAGILLVKLFENRELVAARTFSRRHNYPAHW